LFKALAAHIGHLAIFEVVTFLVVKLGPIDFGTLTLGIDFLAILFTPFAILFLIT
jgi:hypothetical protein